MKVNKDIRDLLLKQSEAFMTSRSSCIYLGRKYTFPVPTDAEIEELRMKLLKNIDEKSYFKQILDWLK